MFCRQAESQSLELVAVALSEEYGIRVVCGGRRAETICLPNGRPLIRIPSVHCEDPNYLSLLRGYIDHEVGHVRFTDRDAIDQTLREKNRSRRLVSSGRSAAAARSSQYCDRDRKSVV